MKKKRSIILCLLAVIVTSTAGSLLFSNTASAAGPAKWIDKGTIELDGKKYIDSKPTDESRDYYENGDKDEIRCLPVIRNFNSDNTSAKLYKRKSVPAFPGASCANTGSETITFDANTVSNSSREVSAAQGQKTQNSCAEKAGPLGWIMCPVIKMLDGVFNWLDTTIQALLEVNEDSYSHPLLYQAWSNIRNIAFIVLIPIMLVMVIGTALGSEMFSAYTVKKALPRMVAAIIFITLSWYICSFLIGFFNVIGSGMIGLITSPFGLKGTITLADLFTPSFGGFVIQGGGIYLAILALGAAEVVPILLLYLGGAVLVFFVAFLILTLRQMMILMLVLAAPLAILAWIFPGNDKMWKAWWGTFSKLLIMFPLITSLIAMGRVFAYLVGKTPAGGLQGGLINPLLKITAYIMPYVLIPLTFKFAGGAFATLTGAVNDRSRGVFDRMKKGRHKRFEHLAENAHSGNLFQGRETGLRGRLNRGAGIAMHASKAGLDPRRWRDKIETAQQDSDAAERKKLGEDPEGVNTHNYDNLMRAIYVGRNREGIEAELREQDRQRMENERQRVLADGGSQADADAAAATVSRYRDPASLGRDVERAERLRRKYSPRAIRQAAVLAMEQGGTAENSGGESLRMLVEAAGGDDAVLMQLVADWRKAAMAGGQVSHGGGSQGAVYNIARRLADPNDNITAEQADELLAQAAITSQGANVLSHQSMKAHDVDRIIQSLQNRIRDAVATGDMDAVDREMAIVNNIQTSLPASAPQLVDRFARDLIQMEIPTDALSNNQLSELDDIVVERRVVQPARTEHVEVRDAAGNPTGRTQVVNIPPVIEDVGAREAVTVQQIHNARRGSAVYNAHTKDYGVQEGAARGAPRGDPGAPPVPPAVGGP